MSKARLVFMEGIDKVGKTTLIPGVREGTGFRHVVVDRGPISNMAYAMKFHRSADVYWDNKDLMANIGPDSVLVIVDASNEDVLQRIKEAGDPVIDPEEDRKLFESVFERCQPDIRDVPVLRVNTSAMSQERAVNKICYWLNRLD